MALTLEQRMALDNAVMNLLLNIDCSLSASEIVSRLGMPVTIQSISPSLRRIMARHPELTLRTRKWGNSHEYSLSRTLTTLDGTLRKERSRLYFGNSANLEIYYDFATGVLSSSCNMKDVCDKEEMISIITRHNIEWVFNYLDRVTSVSDLVYDLACDRIPATCRKGLLKALDTLELPLTGANILKAERFLDLGEKNFAYWNKLTSHYSFSFADKCIFFGYDKLIKLINNSLKNGYIPTQREIENLINLYKECVEAELEVRIDTNRDIKHNTTLLQDLSAEVKNKLLAKKLQVLNGLNGYKINDELEVVVPQGIEDLQKEGEMQNNCVGYFYNAKIRQGRYGIYFIRKTSNVKHSYITCRYDYNMHETVEHRLVNNDWAHVEEIIYQIDMEISKLV